MTLANYITLSRIFLVIPFILFLAIDEHIFILLAFIIFIIASISDYFDGLLARLRKEESDIGKFLDPLADKIIVAAAFISFLSIESLAIPAWAVILIIAREFVINGLRVFAAIKGHVIAASYTGKIKTFMQMTVIIAIFILMLSGYKQYYAGLMTVIVSIFTFYSGLHYLYSNRALFLVNKGG